LGTNGANKFIFHFAEKMSEKEKLYEQNKGTGILYHVFDDGCNCMGCTGTAHWPDIWDCIPVTRFSTG
jgi:hypothetical protein